MDRKLLVVFIFIFFSFLFLLPAKAKDYEIVKVHIIAKVNRDGSMDVREERTYNFQGSFSWANYILPKNKISDVVDFKVSENGKLYERNESGGPGTYTFSNFADHIEAKWHFSARNEKRTFLLSFKVLDAVTIYNDVAELYYKFIGSGWDRKTKEVKVEVTLPEPISKENLRAWAHGPLWGTVRIGNDGRVFLDVNNLPAGKFWEGRILFSPEIVPGCRNRIDKEALSEILSQEKKWAEDANRQRQLALRRSKLGLTLSILLPILAFGIWGIMYFKYGKPYNVPFEGRLYSEIPSDKPPAILSYILNKGNIDASALVSTLLDLAQRGFLKIEEKLETKRGIFGSREKLEYYLKLNRDFYQENKNSLRSFEESLISFIFEELAKGSDSITFEQIKKSRLRFIDWFRGWEKEIKGIADSEGFFEPESIRMRNLSIIMAIALFFIPFLGFLLLKEQGLSFVILFLAGPVLLILSFLLVRYTPEIALEVKKWKALKKYISEFEFRQEPAKDFFENISKYLVYAIVLGLSSNKIKKILDFVPEEYYRHSMSWYAFSSSGRSSFGGFSDAISSMISTVSSTMSSASGKGGGASGGGGGGGGGSGGGAG